MADVATLGVKLEATGTEQVVAALGRVEAAIKGTHQSTVSMGAAIGTASAAASAAFGAIAQAAQGALGAVGGATIGLNASLEQATIGFTTLLKSGEAAQTFLKDLQQFAQSTPFEFKDLIPQAQRLMAMGFAAKDVIPILTDVGNVAAAMGSGKEGIDRITLAIGQMSAATVVHAQDINQLIQAGVPAWDLLAKATGKSTAEVRQLSEAGKISADVFITAFRAWSQNNVGTMMEAQSRTFIGAVSNIKDALGIAVAAGFKPLFDTVRDLAVTFADFVQSETFGIWATDLKITLGQLTPAISALAGWLMGQLPAAMSAAEAAAHAFVGVVQDLGPKIAELAQNVGPVLAAAWEKLGAVLSPVGAALAALGGPLSTVYGAFAQLDELINGTLGAALSGLGGQLADASRNLVNLGAALSTALGGSETAGLDALAATAGRVGDALSALGTLASTVFQDIQIAAVDAANVVIPKLEELRTWLEGNLAPALATVQEAWDGFWSHAGPMVQAMWNVVQPIIGAAIGAELEILKGILTTFKSVWDTVWGGIVAAVEKIAPLVGALASAFGGALAGLSDTITAALNSMQTPVAEAATEVGTTIKNNIVQGAAPVAAEVEAAVAPAATAVTKMGTSASAAAPQVASLGTAGTTAAGGLATASKEAQTLDQVMSQLAKATTPEAVQQALLYQNANAALSEAMKGLTVETQASLIAQKNAGDVYGAVNRAFEAQGLTADDAAAAVHGLASAHDQLAAAAQRAAAAETAAASAGQRMAGISAGGAFAGPTNFGAIAPSPMGAQYGQTAPSIGVNGTNYYIDPVIGPYLRNHPGTEQQIMTNIMGPNYEGTLGVGPAQQEAYQRQLEQLAEAEHQTQIATENQRLEQQKATEVTHANAAATTAATASTNYLAEAQQNAAVGQITDTAHLMEAIRQAGLKASALGQGMDFAAAAQAREFAATLEMTHNMETAAAAAAAAGEQWKLAIANAQALMAGQMRNAGVAGGVTEKGLTYGQIYGNTGTTSGGGAGGSNQGIQNLPPGNYYGIPIVSPLTGGTLHGYADGPFVPEPSYLTSIRSGRTYGVAGEHGPEPIGYGLGGGGAVHITINASGMDALHDTVYWEQLADRQIVPALKRRGLVGR